MKRVATPVLKRNWYAASAALLLALLFFANSAPRLAAKTIDCGLLQDCEMNGFYGEGGAGSGAWKIFKLSGTSRFSLHPVEGWPSGPSVWIQSDNAAFDSGIYQQVAVTPGTGYHFSIPFAVIAINAKHWQDGDQVNRRLGIDPFGGTDANSPNVVWSPDFFGMGRFQDDQLAVDAYAKAPTITVFIRVVNPYTDKHVDVYLDSPTLQVNTSMPPIQVSPPTATPPPPTPVVPPTARPTRVAQQPTATDEPPDTPVPTDTVAPTSTAAPSQTAEPSDSPTRVATRLRRTTPASVATPVEGTPMNVLALSIFGLTGLVGIMGAAILFALAFIFWRRAN